MNGRPPAPQMLPSSVVAVLDALATKAPMTGKELREFTGLPRRTTYTALRRLREMGVLHEKASLRDTRQTYYWLAPSAATPQSQPQPAAQPGLPLSFARSAARSPDDGMVHA
jgi:DNA-binding MarR family transcriptional regulator